MNINALHAFRAIVSEGSAATAAKQLNRSQSSISRLIALLEHELKLSLFHRTRRRLVLTEEGQAFYRETERILTGLNEIPLIAREIRERRRAELRLVVMPRAIAAWVAPATSQFCVRYPNIRVSIDVQRRHDMENWLAGRHYDFGVGALPAQHGAIDAIELFRAPVGAVVKRGHPLAQHAHVGALALLAYPLIGIAPGLLPREQMDYIFRAAAKKPRYAIETTSTLLACELVAEGAGVALLDTVSAAVTEDRTVVIPLDPPEWVSFGLLVPKQTQITSTARLYAEQLREVAARLVKTHRVASLPAGSMDVGAL
jgi:DNA-binding transcriptional LysR family regulator